MLEERASAGPGVKSWNRRRSEEACFGWDFKANPSVSQSVCLECIVNITGEYSRHLQHSEFCKMAVGTGSFTTYRSLD